MTFHLFIDTDSIIFISEPGVPDPPTGDFLGDLTNELKEGQFITQFVSLGPKTYAWEANDGDTCVKLKGFTLNPRVHKIVNMHSMLDMLHQEDVLEIHYDNVLRRVKPKLQITSDSMIKRLRVTYDKRVITSRTNFTTRPYGYIEE